MKNLGFVFLCAAALAGNSFGYWFQAYSGGNWSTVTWGRQPGAPAAPALPGPADDAIIDINLTLNLDTNSTVNTLTLGRGNGTGTLNVSTAGKTLTVNTTTTIGDPVKAGALNVSAGTVTLNGSTTFNAKGVISITNNAATAVTVQSFGTCAGTFKFTLGAAGVTPITVGSAVNLSLAKFTVDVSAYTGGLATIPLLSAPTLTAVSSSVTLTGTRPGWNATVTQDLATGLVAVRMVPPPSLDLILYTK